MKSESSAAPIGRSSSPVARVRTRGRQDLDRICPSAGRRDQGAGGEQAARRDHLIAHREVARPLAEKGGGTRLVDNDPIAVAGDMFLDDHAGRAVGERRAGEDPHRLPRADRSGEARAGRRGAGQPQRRPVIAAHGIAVHRRHRAARRIEGSDDRRGKHPARGIGQRDSLGDEWRHRCINDRPGLVQADQRHRIPLVQKRRRVAETEGFEPSIQFPV